MIHSRPYNDVTHCYSQKFIKTVKGLTWLLRFFETRCSNQEEEDGTGTSSTTENIPDFCVEYSRHTMVALLHLSGFHQEDKLPNLIMQHKLSVLHLLYGYHYVINMNYTLAVADNSTMYIEQV